MIKIARAVLGLNLYMQDWKGGGWLGYQFDDCGNLSTTLQALQHYLEKLCQYSLIKREQAASNETTLLVNYQAAGSNSCAADLAI